MTSRLRVLLRKTHNPEVAGSSPAAATMSSVHNATEHSYVKEQSKGCSFAISMGRPAPVERLSGRSVRRHRFGAVDCQAYCAVPSCGNQTAKRNWKIRLSAVRGGRWICQLHGQRSFPQTHAEAEGSTLSARCTYAQEDEGEFVRRVMENKLAIQRTEQEQSKRKLDNRNRLPIQKTKRFHLASLDAAAVPGSSEQAPMCQHL